MGWGGGDAEEDSGDGEEAGELLERVARRFHNGEVGGEVAGEWETREDFIEGTADLIGIRGFEGGVVLKSGFWEKRHGFCAVVGT